MRESDRDLLYELADKHRKNLLPLMQLVPLKPLREYLFIYKGQVVCPYSDVHVYGRGLMHGELGVFFSSDAHIEEGVLEFERLKSTKRYTVQSVTTYGWGINCYGDWITIKRVHYRRPNRNGKIILDHIVAERHNSPQELCERIQITPEVLLAAIHETLKSWTLIKEQEHQRFVNAETAMAFERTAYNRALLHDKGAKAS